MDPNSARKGKKSPTHYSLDVITDGSSHTGNGTLLFTVLRRPLHDNPVKVPATPVETDNKMKNPRLPSEEETLPDDILARYSFEFSELTSRCCADQRQKMAPIRGTFLSSSSTFSTGGMPSLLLALSNAGSPSLFVCGPPDFTGEFMEYMANRILGKNRSYPKVTTCEVPHSKDDNSSWFKVFMDGYITVHARLHYQRIDEDPPSSYHHHTSNTHDGGTFGWCVLYMVHTTITTNNDRSLIFGIGPPISEREWRSVPPPAEVVAASSKRKDGSHLLDFVCHLNAAARFDGHASPPPSVGRKSSRFWRNQFATGDPRDGHDLVTADTAGILSRAFRWSRLLNRALPPAFGLRSHHRGVHGSGEQNGKPDVQFLAAGESLVFSSSSCDFQMTSATALRRQKKDSEAPSWINHVMDKVDKKLHSDVIAWYDNDNDNIPFSKNLSKLQPQHQEECDENEIDLDDMDNIESPKPRILDSADCNEIDLEESSHDEKHPTISNHPTSPKSLQSPQIIILGTGCASPSPHRGSSAIAILLPSTEDDNTSSTLSFTALLDCGEGCLTALSQFLPPHRTLNQYLKQLKWIWISHSHLDHYGGLPSLIQKMDLIQKQGETTDAPPCTMCLCRYPMSSSARKRRKQSRDDNIYVRGTCGCPCHDRREDDNTVIVIAPALVLEYLDASLQCKNGTRKCGLDATTAVAKKRLYWGVTHKDFEFSPFAQHLREKVFQTPRRFHPPSHGRPNDQNRVVHFRSVPVHHCPHAYALILGLDITPPDPTNRHHDLPQSAFYLCYSGDTRPSPPALIRSCLQSVPHGGKISLLVHESTFDDSEHGKREAVQKRHSTMREAMETCIKMGCEACVLTHFSQRYSKLSVPFLEVEKNCEEFLQRGEGLNAIAAVDGMTLPLRPGGYGGLGLVNRFLGLALQDAEEYFVEEGVEKELKD